MVEYLIPVDVEPEAVTEIEARWDAVDSATVHMGTQIPNQRPTEFGRVVTVGGAGRDLVTDQPTLVLEGFAVTEARAQRICALMIATLQAAGRAGRIGSATCYGVRVVALPANLPLPSVPDRFRYTATVSVDLRRATV